MKKALGVLGKTMSALLSIVLVLLIATVGYLTYCNVSGNVAYFNSYALVQIVSPSMEPTIPVGEYILVNKFSNQPIEKNDIILFVSSDEAINGKLNTHRVVGVKEKDGVKSYTTKGDNNALEDKTPVTDKDIDALYVKNLPLITKIASVFMKKTSFIFLIIVPAFILIAVCVLDVFKKAQELKKEERIAAEVKRLKEQDKNKNNDSED